MISYGTAAAFLVWLSLLFLSWYKSNHNLIVVLYFISILAMAFNLVVTAVFTSAKVSDRPFHAGEYVGGSGDISGGKHLFLENTYRISTFVSFLSIWITTAIFMNYYREKRISKVVSWLVLSIPFVYFLITYFYQYILSGILITYMQIDPITVSIVLGAFLSLSKPIGGWIFGVAFWMISKITSYEKNIKTYMIISGWGIFLIFSANQATVQIVSPYPPFGLATITVLDIAAFLMLAGIYNSARYVSVNNNLRKTIRKHALESRLLDAIGKSERENEIQKIITKITLDKKNLSTQTKQPTELDEKELEKYVRWIIREAREKGKN